MSLHVVVEILALTWGALGTYGAVRSRRGHRDALRRQEQLQGQLAEQDAIIRAQSEIAAADLGREALMRLIVERTQELTGADGAVVELVDGEVLVYAHASGDSAAALGQRLARATSLSGRCVAEGTTLISVDTSVDPRVDAAACRRVGAGSLVVAPLRHRGEVVGVLKVTARRAHTLGPRHVRTLEVMSWLIAAAMGHRTALELGASQRGAMEHGQLALLDALNEPALVLGRGAVVHANAAALRTFGYATLAEVVGRPATELVAVEERAQSGGGGAGSGGGPFAALRGTRKDGSALALEAALVPSLFDAQPVELAILRDVSERNRLAARAMEADRMIAVGTLAAGVGHEINNPLAFVLSNLDFSVAELAARGEGREREAILEALGEARQGAVRIRDIVRDLKAHARAPEARKPTDLHEVLDRAVRVATSETRHRAQVVKSYGELPQVLADEAQLGQVFLNLIVNAAQAIPAGAPGTHQIRLGTGRVAGGLCVTVEDTGVGMTPAVQQRIFDPFFTTKPLGQGTGLGLSTSRAIVEAMNGHIEVESTPGKGTTFRVFLPGLPGAELAPTSAQPAPAAAPPPPRTRILYVDDEPHLCLAMARWLGRNHEVVTVQSARDALARLVGPEDFDVVICDLNMPDIGGIELFHRVQAARPELRDRFVFATGAVFTDDAATFLETVPNARLAKPFDFTELDRVIERVAAEAT